ncbi:hypothetical protein KC353_g18700 [Hortaea werneckii]|nr:hypothetical protein KC353_g18700 [Hortaea werneckii]
MVGMLDADHTDAVDLGHFNSPRHTNLGCNEAESVLAINLGHCWSLLNKFWLRLGIVEAFPDPSQIRWESVYAVRVHASEIGGHETLRDDIGVMFGKSGTDKQRRREKARLVWRDSTDRRFGGLHDLKLGFGGTNGLASEALKSEDDFGEISRCV